MRRHHPVYPARPCCGLPPPTQGSHGAARPRPYAPAGVGPQARRVTALRKGLGRPSPGLGHILARRRGSGSLALAPGPGRRHLRVLPPGLIEEARQDEHDDADDGPEGAEDRPATEGEDHASTHSPPVAARVSALWQGITSLDTHRQRGSTGWQLVLRPVHPHPRGENAPHYDHPSDMDGSPPRAWGKRERRCAPTSESRFTPTRVGKTLGDLNGNWGYSVHPHARGENRAYPTRVSPRDGSPPRAWGKRCRSTAAAAASTVHPHARGENGMQRQNWQLQFGSPPRAWGKQLLPVDGQGSHRFTPTRVGKT